MIYIWWGYMCIYIYVYIYLYVNQTMGIFCIYYISGSSLLNSFCFQRYEIPTEKYVFRWLKPPTSCERLIYLKSFGNNP